MISKFKIQTNDLVLESIIWMILYCRQTFVRWCYSKGYS